MIYSLRSVLYSFLQRTAYFQRSRGNSAHLSVCLNNIMNRSCSIPPQFKFLNGGIVLPNKCSTSSELDCSPMPVKIFRRCYAKGKDKKREKAKSKNVTINEGALSEMIDLESLKNGMGKALVQMKQSYSEMLSLRSTTGSIERLHIKVDGKDHVLQEVAQISRKNPKMVVINLGAFPQAISPAVKALSKSSMNLNPQQDGSTIYIPIPKISKEYRETLAKSASVIYMKCRDNMKQIQIQHIKQLKKKDKVSEDVVRNIEQQIAALTDRYIEEAKEILQAKTDELVGKE